MALQRTISSFNLTSVAVDSGETVCTDTSRDAERADTGCTVLTRISGTGVDVCAHVITIKEDASNQSTW